MVVNTKQVCKGWVFDFYIGKPLAVEDIPSGPPNIWQFFIFFWKI